MNNTFAFLAGLVVGAAVTGAMLLAVLFVVLEYRKHPEWFDEEDDTIDIDID